VVADALHELAVCRPDSGSSKMSSRAEALASEAAYCIGVPYGSRVWVDG
jgi:hypothetical protein